MMADNDDLDFIGAAERRAKTQGKTLQQFLDDLFNTRPTTTPDCLEPNDVEGVGFKFAALTSSQQEHVMNCSYCASLLGDSFSRKPPTQ